MKKLLLYLFLLGLLLLTGCSLTDIKDSVSSGETGLNEPSRVVETKSSVTETGVENSGKVEATDTAKAKLPVTLYYQDASGSLIPVTRKVERQEGIARAALNGLIDNAMNREELEYFGIYPVLPAGTQVLGLNIKEGTAVVDFNNNLLGYKDAAAERTVLSSIVYTLTEFKTINRVKILVNGFVPRKLKYDADITELLDRNNVMVNSGKFNVGVGFSKSDIYVFKYLKETSDSNEPNGFIIPLSIEHSAITENNLPAKIIELLAGYDNKSTESEFPSDVSLLESSIDGKTLTLDFESGFKSYGGGSAREERLLKQILYSMKQINGIEKVRVLIEGQKGGLPEGTDISGELAIPVVINDILDK